MVVLGAVTLTELNDATQTRDFPTDTSFEPYRREAFRHRSIPAQRESINLDNTSGRGTVNTEGLWRREQIDWGMGAGQLFLDRKGSQENRFYQSKGVDVFSFPYQATLLPDTHRVDSIMSPASNILMTRCNNNVVVANDNSVVIYNSSWSGTSATFGSTYGGTAPSHIYSITSNDLYVFLATDTGIWFCETSNTSAFQLYAASDLFPFIGYSMVRWANNQLIASSLNRLYAFQPRDAATFPIFGSVPSVGDTNVMIQNIISVSGSGSAEVTTTTPHNLSVDQPFTIANTSILAYINPGDSPGFSGTKLTLSSSPDQHGFNVGDSIIVSLQFGNGANRTETAKVTAVPTNEHFTYVPQKVGTPVYATGLTSGTAVGDENGEFNADWVVDTIISTTQATFVVPTNFAFEATGGSVTTSTPPDVLTTHENFQWIWTDAAGGETQIYFSGYVLSTSEEFFPAGTGYGYSGCIYRSNLLGASTSVATGVATISNSTVSQPFSLDTPVQALPMSPDEYPMCVESYLNYIFVGTNRGIRMCQTLSIYDPTATATGDLKSGPLSPNITQPVTSPVTAIVGDGRYVWFAWANYDNESTGLGKLDLSTNINEDPLAPAYASDIMVTGQGVINSLDWDPSNNAPLMAVASLGVFTPFATNEGGNLVVSQFVEFGFILSSFFDYGLSEAKIPVFFDYAANAESPSAVQGTVVVDSNALPTLDPYSNTDPTEVSVQNTAGQIFQVEIDLTTTQTDLTPILQRWTLKSWPAVVSGTNIMMVIKNFQVDLTDGIETYRDPYDNFIWLENRRQSQTLMTYTEGPLSVLCVISLMDWLPEHPRDTYENGYVGDIVVTLTTLAEYVYTPTATS